jgi:hypothetical protein
METKAFYQVSDRAAHYAAPTKNDPSFLIFGEDVCRIFADTGMIRKVIRAINEGTDAVIFIFTPGKTTPEELLSTYQGWGDYAFISKNEYNQLARAIGAEVVREGEEKYSPAVRNFEHLFKARSIIFDLRILFNRLSEAWTEADNDSPIHPALNNSNYPFDESFDELVPRINEWLKEAETRILQSEIRGEPLPAVEESRGRYVKGRELLDMKLDTEIAMMRNRELVSAIEKLNSLIVPKYYVVKVWGDVEPELSVPSPTEEMRDSLAKQMKKEDDAKEGENYSGIYWLNIVNGLPEIGSYSGVFFEDDTLVEEDPGSYSRPSFQCSLFTSEQMTGSGQLNMLDQINQVADVKRRLKSTPAVFWNDPGHGWFEANYSDLVLLDIHRIISGYSYRKGDKVYLEEDCDATKYVKAIFGEHPENDPMFPLWKSMIRDEYRENIFIRKLNHYRP